MSKNLSDKPIEELTPAEIKVRLEQARLRKELLELEHLETVVANERTKREAIARAAAAQMVALDNYNRDVKQQQKNCKHRKGGKNQEGILKGHDSNYSVIFHTYPWGELVVMCTRCGKEFRQPTADLKKFDKAAYDQQLQEYKTALEYPTDNEPSGTQLFVITRTTAA